jgi:peptide/nickel transport system permease protein
VYAWPGVGTLILSAISSRDYLVVQAALLMLVLIFIVVNLFTDILYGFIDPRIRLSAESAR